MSDALYNDRILALAASLDKNDRLARPDVSVTVSSALCGSRVKVDLTAVDGLVAGYGQEVRACALGQSSAALMKRIVIGKSLKSVAGAAAELRAMLAGEAGPPGGDWAAYEALLPARNHRSRHASILLPFDGVLKAFAEMENPAGAKVADHAG